MRIYKGSGEERPKTFGGMVARRRRQAGLSQEELAAKVGVGVKAICKVERRSIDIARSRALAIGHALGMTDEEICLP